MDKRFLLYKNKTVDIRGEAALLGTFNNIAEVNRLLDTVNEEVAMFQVLERGNLINRTTFSTKNNGSPFSIPLSVDDKVNILNEISMYLAITIQKASTRYSKKDKRIKMRNDIFDFSMSRTNAFSLFNTLIVQDATIFVEVMESHKTLLNKLWLEIADEDKIEGLWSNTFRDYLIKWNISYINDLKRLNIPFDITVKIVERTI